MIKPRLFKQFLNILSVLSLSAIVGSNFGYASDFHSPRTASLGGAGHASPLLNDAIILNPSFAAFLPTYAISVNYLKYSGSDDFHGRNYNVSLQDGRSELFQAGASFTMRQESSIVHFGASHSFVKRFGFGLGGKVIFPHSNVDSVKDATLSFSGIATDWFQGSVIVDNLLQSDGAQALGFYREYILATKFNLKSIVLIYYDPHLVPSLPNANSYGHELGLEFVMMPDVFLRVGQFINSNVPHQNAYGRGYGIGIGWIAPRLSLDYGIERVLEPRMDIAHTFGATVYF